MSPKNSGLSTSKGGKISPAKGAQGGLKDPHSEAILAEAGALGNSEMQRLLEKSKKNRDALLEFLVSRLTEMRRLQLQETDHLRKRDEWFIAVHKGADHLPNPNRWHTAAATYKEAALALCRGDIQRGAQLLATALTEESDAQKDLPNALAETQPSLPSAPKSNQDTVSTSRPLPAEIKLADQILSSQNTVDPASTRRKRLHDWFSLEEDEKEEEDDNADG